MKIIVDKNYKNDLKFIRVKDYCIIFKYRDDKFLMIFDSDNVFVYKMPTDENGKYTTEYMNDFVCRKELLIQLKKSLPEKRRKTLVYSQIDKEQFCTILTYHKIMEGYFEPEVHKLVMRNYELAKDIKALNHLIQRANDSMFKFS